MSFFTAIFIVSSALFWLSRVLDMQTTKSALRRHPDHVESNEEYVETGDPKVVDYAEYFWRGLLWQGIATGLALLPWQPLCIFMGACLLMPSIFRSMRAAYGNHMLGR